MAVAEGRVDHARQILNGPEREPWRRAVASLRHMSAGFCAPLVAALGDHDQIVALHDELIDYSGTWLVKFTNTYLGAADHHLGVLARALGRPTRPKNGFAPRSASYDAAPERLFRAAALVELAELAAERDDEATVPRPARHGRTRGAPDGPRAAPGPVRPPAELTSPRPGHKRRTRR